MRRGRPDGHREIDGSFGLFERSRSVVRHVLVGLFGKDGDEPGSRVALEHRPGAVDDGRRTPGQARVPKSNEGRDPELGGRDRVAIGAEDGRRRLQGCCCLRVLRRRQQGSAEPRQDVRAAPIVARHELHRPANERRGSEGPGPGGMVGSAEEGVDESGPDARELGGGPGRVCQLEGPVEVGDDDLARLADHACEALSDPRGGSQVLRQARPPGEPGVGDISKEPVPEDELGFAPHRGRLGGADELPASQLGEVPLALAGLAIPDRGHGTRPERPADDRGVEQDGLLAIRQRVDPGREQRGDRGRDGRLVEPGGAVTCRPVPEGRRQLLGVERAAGGALENCGRHLRRGAWDQLGNERRHGWLRKRRQGDDAAAPGAGQPGRVALLELGAGGRHEEQREPRDVIGEVAEEGDEGVVGPVEVLDDEDRGASPGDRIRGTGARR